MTYWRINYGEDHIAYAHNPEVTDSGVLRFTGILTQNRKVISPSTEWWMTEIEELPPKADDETEVVTE